MPRKPATVNRMNTRLLTLTSVLITLLIVKFFWTWLVYELPLGYDPGVYRYLFLQYAEAWPPFIMPDIHAWWREHPPVLFMFSTLLMRVGVPVDWFLGWLWNGFCVALLCVYARIMAQRMGLAVGVLTLLAGLLSQAYFDGFTAMYWKTFAALLFCVLTFAALERRSWTGVLFALLCIGTHHQTALILVLSVLSWWLVEGARDRFQSRQWRHGTLVGTFILCVGLLWYVPAGWDFVVFNVQKVLSISQDVYGGSFPPRTFYLQVSGILLTLGIYGFLLDFERGRGTLWQFAVLWSALFVVGKLYFYRRFFLQMDFFLLPFAALAIVTIYQAYTRTLHRALLGLALGVQAALMIVNTLDARPIISVRDFSTIAQLAQHVEPDHLILVPENQTALWVQGWLPDHEVAGPGLLNFRWPKERWHEFIYGTHNQRAKLLRSLKRPVSIVILPYFFAHYRQHAVAFVNDPCFQPVAGTPLLLVDCREEAFGPQ